MYVPKINAGLLHITQLHGTSFTQDRRNPAMLSIKMGLIAPSLQSAMNSVCYE